MKKQDLTIASPRPNASIKNRTHASIVSLLENYNNKIIEMLERKTAKIVLANDAKPHERFLSQLAKIRSAWGATLSFGASKIAKEHAKSISKNTITQLNSAMKASGFTVKRILTAKEAAVAEAAVAEMTSLIKSIGEQHMTRVTTAVTSAIMTGGDAHSIKTALKESFGISNRRAELIALDQTNKVTETISRAKSEDIGITHGIWMHRGGSKNPRHSHIMMDGQRFNLSEGLYDVDVGRNVLPAELIYCRCTHRLDISSILTQQ